MSWFSKRVFATLQRLGCIAVTTAIVLTAEPASAESLIELGTKIQLARFTLIEMFNGRTDLEQQKKVQDSAESVTNYLLKMDNALGERAEFLELKVVWQDFRQTREQQIVPAILRGRVAEARTIFVRVQKPRLERALQLISILQER
jgi:hypothetical protein